MQFIIPIGVVLVVLILQAPVPTVTAVTAVTAAAVVVRMVLLSGSSCWWLGSGGNSIADFL